MTHDFLCRELAAAVRSGDETQATALRAQLSELHEADDALYYENACCDCGGPKAHSRITKRCFMCALKHRYPIRVNPRSLAAPKLRSIGGSVVLLLFLLALTDSLMQTSLIANQGPITGITPQALLGWDASASPGVTYNLYRSTDNQQGWAQIASSATLTGKVILLSGTNFFYVTATDGSNESAPSNIVEIDNL